jgi:hypothetical protein
MRQRLKNKQLIKLKNSRKNSLIKRFNSMLKSNKLKVRYKLMTKLDSSRANSPGKTSKLLTLRKRPKSAKRTSSPSETKSTSSLPAKPN